MRKKLAHILDRFPNKLREDLIPLLSDIQSEFGYLPQDAIVEVSKYLSISLNKVYGVATFYDTFWFSPKGKFHIKVCNGTACKIENSTLVISEIEKQLKINAGHTDSEGNFSLEIVSCLGGCAQAPVMEINQEFHIRIKISELKYILAQCNAKAEMI